jgi:hypothetical protein
MERGRVGYKRVIVIAIVSTAFAVTLDYFGIIDAIAKRF